MFSRKLGKLICVRLGLIVLGIALTFVPLSFAALLPRVPLVVAPPRSPSTLNFPNIRPILQNVRRLAVQDPADRVERRKTDRLRFAGFQDGHVLRRDADCGSKFVQTHFPFRQNHIQIHDNRHRLRPSVPVLPEVSALRP